MLKMLLALVPLVGVPAAALAKTLELGSAPPVASVTFPDAWDVEAADGGFEALSPDKAIYLSGEVVASDDLKEAGQDLGRTLAEQKISLKQDTRKVAPLNVGGMAGASISWDGTDESGPTQVHMIVLKAKPGQEVVLLRWGDEAAETANASDIGAIVKSLAPQK